MRYLTIATILFVFFVMHGCWGIDISVAGYKLDAVPITITGIKDLNVFYHTSLLEVMLSTLGYLMYLFTYGIKEIKELKE